MRNAARKAQALLGVYYAYMTTYRAELFFWMVATLLPLIMMGPWMVAGRTGRFPLDEAAFARYFVAVFITRQFSLAWVIYDFEVQVVTGRLSPQLLHPIDPGWRFVAAHLAEHAARLPFVVLAVALVLLAFPDARWTPPAGDVLLALAATYAAFALRFLIQYTLAMLAFWYERVSAVDRLLMIPYVYVSGLIAPLAVFPADFREVVLWTPFPYMVWFPAVILTGGEPVSLAQGFATIGAWIVVLVVANRLLWRAGLRRYSAMGA